MRDITLCAAVLTVSAPAAQAQQNRNSQVVDSAVGEVGQRQSREKLEIGGNQLGLRADTRINNRVQLRFQNRLDRFYNPQTATTAIQAASNRARSAGAKTQR